MNDRAIILDLLGDHDLSNDDPLPDNLDNDDLAIDISVALGIDIDAREVARAVTVGDLLEMIEDT